MSFDPDLHRRRSIRLREYDYASVGAYFVTICVQGRECLFGDIADGSMHVNDSGRVVEHVWLALSEQFPCVVLDEFIVMPNHFHGIICIAAPGLDSKSETKGGENRGAATKSAASSAPTEPTIGKIMRAFKSISAINVNRLSDRQGVPLWQRNYYERIIRDDKELAATRDYIIANPANWSQDEEYPS